MRLTPIGRRLLGQGNGTVSVDGMVIATEAGGVCPLSDRAIYQKNGGLGSILMASSLDGRQSSVVDGRGANYLRAGGGVWAAFLWPGGVRCSGGYTDPAAVLLDVGPDGLIWTMPYQASGPIRGYWWNGTLAVTGPISPVRLDSLGAAFRALSGGRAAWVEGTSLRTFGFEAVTPSWPIFAVVPVEEESRIWLLELGDGRLTLRLADRLDGYVVATGLTFQPDAVALEGSVIVGWSTGAGEQPNEGRSVVVDLWAGMVSLAPPVPSAVVPSFPSTAQTIGVGVMDEPDAPILVGWDKWIVPPPEQQVVGLFCTANLDDMVRVRATSRYVDVPLYVYWDEPEYQHTAEGDEIGAAQAYPRADESRESFRARLHRAVDAGARCFVFAAYCQWNGATYTLSEQIALDSERDVWDVAVARGVTALWGFVYSRGDGIDGLVRWPSLQESVRRMRAASDDWSVFPAREQTPEPAPDPPAEPEPSPAPEPAPNPEPVPTPEPLVRIQIGNQWSVMPRSQALAIQAQQWATVQAMRANMPPGWEPAPLPPLEPVEREP